MSGPFRAPPALLLIGALFVGGCSGDGMLGGGLTTASVPEAPKVDPVCITLTAQIDGLRKDGIAEKVEKAAAKKYRMTNADLAKADQLNKANAEYQARCGLSPQVAPATTAGAAPAAPPAAQPAVVASVRPNPTVETPILREVDGP